MKFGNVVPAIFMFGFLALGSVTTLGLFNSQNQHAEVAEAWITALCRGDYENLHRLTYEISAETTTQDFITNVQNYLGKKVGETIPQKCRGTVYTPKSSEEVPPAGVDSVWMFELRIRTPDVHVLLNVRVLEINGMFFVSPQEEGLEFMTRWPTRRYDSLLEIQLAGQNSHATFGIPQTLISGEMTAVGVPYGIFGGDAGLTHVTLKATNSQTGAELYKVTKPIGRIIEEPRFDFAVPANETMAGIWWFLAPGRPETIDLAVNFDGEVIAVRPVLAANAEQNALIDFPLSVISRRSFISPEGIPMLELTFEVNERLIPESNPFHWDCSSLQLRWIEGDQVFAIEPQGCGGGATYYSNPTAVVKPQFTLAFAAPQWESTNVILTILDVSIPGNWSLREIYNGPRGN
jgi:hypothetical protein